MHYSPRVSLLVVAVFLTPLLTAACSDSDARQLGPSGINTSSLMIEPTTSSVSAQRVIDPFCPTIPPFTVAFGVNVRSNASDMRVSHIRFQFTDTAGLQSPLITLPSPSVTLPAPGPTQTFGDPVNRTIPIVLGIGCVTGTRGTVVVIVETVDDRGRTNSGRAMVTVR